MSSQSKTSAYNVDKQGTGNLEQKNTETKEAVQNVEWRSYNDSTGYEDDSPQRIMSTHVVQRGETAGSASRLGGVLLANDLRNPNLIRAGDVLVIPPDGMFSDKQMAQEEARFYSWNQQQQEAKAAAAAARASNMAQGSLESFVLCSPSNPSGFSEKDLALAKSYAQQGGVTDYGPLQDLLSVYGAPKRPSLAMQQAVQVEREKIDVAAYQEYAKELKVQQAIERGDLHVVGKQESGWLSAQDAINQQTIANSWNKRFETTVGEFPVRLTPPGLLLTSFGGGLMIGDGINNINDGNIGKGMLGIGLGALDVYGSATFAKTYASVATNGGRVEGGINLFRRTENTGEFAGLNVPMQMRFVEQAAADGGIGLQGVKVRIVRDPDLVGKNLYGYTHPNGSIDLYPDAFTNTEQLVKTIGHERTHTMQIKLYGHPNSYGDRMMEELMLNEKAAHGIEDTFWNHYLQSNSGKMEKFR